MARPEPLSFRPTSAQMPRVEALIDFYGNQTAMLQAAVDLLYEKVEDKIEAIQAQIEAARAAQAELDAAREAVLP